jgi:hypothetical protein
VAGKLQVEDEDFGDRAIWEGRRTALEVRCALQRPVPKG